MLRGLRVSTVLNGVAVAFSAVVLVGFVVVMVRPTSVPSTDFKLHHYDAADALGYSLMKPLPKDARVVVLGDAWADSPGASSAKHGWLQIAAARYGWRLSVLPGGVGSGYLAHGSAGVGTYVDRLRRRPQDPAVDLVIVQGGTDGLGAAKAETALEAAAAEVFTVARGRYPNAQVLAVTGVYPRADVPDNVQALSNDIVRAADAAKVPVIPPPDYGWLTDTTGHDPLLQAGGRSSGFPTDAGYANLAGALGRAMVALGGLHQA